MGMTLEEFEDRYQSYRTHDKEAAVREALGLRVEGGKENKPVAVAFPLAGGTEYGLMTMKAYVAARMLYPGLQVVS